MNLNDIRQEIDVLDGKILKLINERMEKAILTRRLKNDALDEGREKQVLEHVRSRAAGLSEPDFLEKLYQEIMAESRRLQGKGHRTIGFLGEHGTNSELACKAWNRDVIPIPCGDFASILENVASGLFDYGILPVENTLGGVVGQANSLLIYTELSIVSAVDLPISYCLMAAPGTDYREIRKVYSHPQSLMQCRQFLSRAKLEAMPHNDTASAARMIAEERPSDAAAIANSLCAELYGLTVIKEGIEDSNICRTRFFVLSKEKAAGGAKTSIVFTTENKAGALFHVLEIFARSGINLTRIESVPNRPGEYAIFVDLVGGASTPAVSAALEAVKKHTSEFRVLGSYDETVVPLQSGPRS